MINEELIEENTKTNSYHIHVSPMKIRNYLFLIIFSLVIASMIGIYLKDTWDISIVNRLFNLDKEANFPTLFSSTLLLASASILFIISRISASKKIYWSILSLIFLFLCIDEACQIHEIFNNRSTQIAEINNTKLKHLWVIPYFVLVVIAGFFFKDFLFTLPGKTRNLFIFSGVIYVTGAIGLEILQELLSIYSQYADAFILKLLYSLEEAMEMFGISIFIYALLNYITPISLFTHIDHTNNHEPES